MHATWNRRSFLTALGISTVAGALPKHTAAAEPASSSVAAPASFIAAAVLGGLSPAETTVSFYGVQGQTWTALRTVPLANAQTITLHPSQPIAYIGRHSHAADPLPRACLTTLSLSGDTLQHQPLSLSGTFPNSLALSPNARHLLVALSTGGAYNVVPLSPRGEPGPVTHRRKHTGRGPHPAQTSALPHSVLFHPSGTLAYSTDHGADRLNLLELGPETLHLRDALRLSHGSGPTFLALHPAADCLYFISPLGGLLSSLPVEPKTGRIAGPLLTVATPNAVALAVHPSGRFLYLAHSALGAHPPSLSIARFAQGSSSPRHIATVSLPKTLAVHSLHVLADQILLATNSGLLTAELQPRTGLPGSFHQAVAAGPVLSLALRSL